MNIFDKQLLTIAKRTLQMSPAMADVMGGMNRETARQILEAADERKRREDFRREEWKREQRRERSKS
jgi:hypothetical protein